MADHFQKQMKIKRGKFCPEVGAVAPAGGKAVHIIPDGDKRRVPGQHFLVMSYATPDGSTKVRSPRGMVQKFSGCFDTLAAAEAHADAIRREDPRFDVYVVDLYEWLQVPMPDEEKHFVKRKYVDDMLTRIVTGLQNSMEQGKKEMDERKARDRSKAEAAIRAVKGPDYKMPEKSDLLLKYEEEIRKKREEEEKKAEEELRECRIMHSENDIANIAMQYFVEHAGEVIDAGSGSSFMKYFIMKTIERGAEMARAKDRERQDDGPDKVAEIREKQANEEAESQGDAPTPLA